MTNKTEEQIHEEAYWDREYSGDIELGRAKSKIKELEQELISFNHLKSISWNLNRIANVLESIKQPTSDEVGFAKAMFRTNNSDEPVASSIRDMLKKKRKQSFEESSYE